MNRETTKVITYNVRRCLGVDGLLSPARVAQVIDETGADIISLQELDVGRLRSDGVDQAHEIARLLGIANVHFHPAMRIVDELYGDAILTRGASRLVKVGTLPRTGASRSAEPRGALWAAVEFGGVELQVVNTHFGLGRQERRAQATALLGPDWLDHPACKHPLILTGDLNSLPPGRTYSMFAARMRDAHIAGGRGRVRSTFPSTQPFFRIDHIFTTDDVEIVSATVWRSPTARLASDHLPLLVEFRLPE